MTILVLDGHQETPYLISIVFLSIPSILISLLRSIRVLGLVRLGLIRFNRIPGLSSVSSIIWLLFLVIFSVVIAQSLSVPRILLQVSVDLLPGACFRPHVMDTPVIFFLPVPVLFPPIPILFNLFMGDGVVFPLTPFPTIPAIVIPPTRRHIPVKRGDIRMVAPT